MSDLTTSVLEGLSARHRPGELLEVRCFDGERIDSGYFTDPQIAAVAIAAHVARYPQATICTTLNPIKPESLNGHAVDRIRVSAPTATRDADIACRRWFLIDADPDRPADTSATDDEVQRALDRREAVKTWLVGEQGWPEPIEAMSGNGGHLDLALDLPVNDDTDKAIKGALAAIAQKFSGGGVTVDTTVGNRARVCKVYGTFAHKGTATAERPHRRAEIERVPDVLVPVTLAQLQAVAALATNGNSHRPAMASAGASRPSGTVLDMPAEFSARGLYLCELSGGRHAVTCPWAHEHSVQSGVSETVLFEPRAAGEVWGFKCQHAHCAHRTIKDVWELFRPSGANYSEARTDNVPPPGDSDGPSDVAGDEPLSNDTPPVRRWQHASEAIDAPTPEAIVEGIAYADAISVLVSESGAGKTFVFLSVDAAVSAGLRWHGREVRQGSVVYIGYEGYVGLRLRALRDVAGHRLEHVYIIPASDPLSPIIDRDRIETPSRGEVDVARDLDAIVGHIIATGRPAVKLVAIDTIRASLSGSEDNSEAASAYLRAVRRLMGHVPGAAWMLAHHAGWQDGETRHKRERGSSAFRGNVDATFYLEAGEYDRDRGEARLTLSTLKVRDGEKPPPLHLIRRRVEIPGLADRWGQPVTSCLIESDRRTREDREAEQAEAAEVETRALDLRTLRIVAEHPTLATSQDQIRIALGVRTQLTRESIARNIDRGWMLPPAAQRKPYTLTASGTAALLGHSTSRTQSDRVGPESDPSVVKLS